MQADIEGAYSDGKRLAVDASIGRAQPRGKARYLNDWMVSRRHWVSIKVGPESEIERYQVRFGRFYPAYGINVPEHTMVTRKQLGFDQQQETYNAEMAFIDEDWNVFATYIVGRPDNPERSQEMGGAVQVSKVIGSSHRIGINGFYGKDVKRVNREIRRMLGAFGLLGFNSQLYALTDFSWTYDQVNFGGMAEFLKFGWEFTQGVHLLATQQLSW